MRKPEFSQDWFSNNIDSWRQYVLPQLKSIKFPRCLEIGAFEGRSSVFLLENIPDLHLTVVDPWCFTANSTEATFDVFKKNINPWFENVEILKGKSELARFLPGNSFDMVYVDGEHTSATVIHDAVISYQLLKVGGLLVFDDYLGGDSSIMYPKPAIDFFHNAYSALEKIELVFDGYQRIYKKLGGMPPCQF